MIAGRTQATGAAMAAEREHLRPLAAEGFDLAAVSFPVIDTQGTAVVLTNFYSAPLEPGTKVEAKAYASHVELWHEGRLVARHERCFSRRQKILDLEHYLTALAKKPGALTGATALEQWRGQGRWPESFDRFWEKLREQRGRHEGTRAMVDVLLMGRAHGFDALRRAMEGALQTGASDVAAVRYLIESERREARPAAEALEVGWLRRYERALPTLNNYDRLLAAGREAIQ